MSILSVEHLSHGFGDREIFRDVSFRLLKGEHIGLVGANGEGKSTFMSIITRKLEPDAGKIEWAKKRSGGVSGPARGPSERHAHCRRPAGCLRFPVSAGGADE